jgi:hypothetical protein
MPEMSKSSPRRLQATHLLALVYQLSVVASLAAAQTLPLAKFNVGVRDQSQSQSAAADRARVWLHSAVEAMGGEARLRAIKSLRIKGEGYTNLLEQSERPEGPWIVSYEEITELRDLEGHRRQQTFATRGLAASPEIITVTANGAATSYTTGAQPVPVGSVPADDGWLALAPERVLLTALEAADLRAEGEMTLQGVAHHVAAFSWQGTVVRVFLNADTHLPTAVETVRAYPYDAFWGVWGDVRTRTYFSFWTLSGGLHYPLQWDMERNGQPYKSLALTELKINPALPVDSFDMPDGTRKFFASRTPVTIEERPLGRPDRPAQEIAPGVMQIPGNWNVALVCQPDGVVIIEAPISSGYSAKVLAEAARRFPGLPVKAVVSTSDAWPHIGGVREYVARGVPVYALDLNRAILERLVVAPHHSLPDALARTPRKPIFRIVSQKTVIGAGENSLELYPVRTETGERMLMVYLPGRLLLYASDLVQGPGPDGSFFMPQYLSELMDAVQRNRLTVEMVFAMHAAPTSWTKITAAVGAATTESEQPSDKAPRITSGK